MGKHRTTEEWLTLADEKCKQSGFSISEVGLHSGCRTQLKVQRGNVVRRCTAASFVNSVGTFGIGRGRGEKRQAKPMVDKFTSSGLYLEGTEFTRIGGSRAAWQYTCPVCSVDEYVQAGLCGGVFRSDSRSLTKGAKCCRCSRHFRWTTSQREYQIQKVLSENWLPFTFVRWEAEYGYKSAEDFLILNCKVSGDFRKRAHSFFNGNSYGPAHWDMDRERPAHFYILSVQGDGGNFTGYGISGNIKERLVQHRANLKSAGYTYDKCEIFSGKWKEALEVERDTKVIFERAAQGISGFRTEATLAYNYSEVVAFAQRSRLVRLPINEKLMYNA